MQFIGITHHGEPWAAALAGTRVLPLVPVTGFWADAEGWQDKAASLVAGAAGNEASDAGAWLGAAASPRCRWSRRPPG